jgi:hypothetical protein
MAVYSSKYADISNIPTSSQGGNEIVVRASIKFLTAVTLAENDVLRFARLPAGYALTSVELDNDALGTAAVASVGILNTAETAVASAAITSANIATAGIKLDNSSAARRAAVSDDDRMVGAVVTTAASAALAQNAVVGLTLRYRPKQVLEPVS